MNAMSRAPVRFDRQWASPPQATPCVPVAAEEASLSLGGHLCHREDIHGRNRLISCRDPSHQRRHWPPCYCCAEQPTRSATAASLATVGRHISCACPRRREGKDPTRSIVRAIIDTVRNIPGYREEISILRFHAECSSGIHRDSSLLSSEAELPIPCRNWEIGPRGCLSRNTKLPRTTRRMAPLERADSSLEEEGATFDWQRVLSALAAARILVGFILLSGQRHRYPFGTSPFFNGTGNLDKRSPNDT